MPKHDAAGRFAESHGLSRSRHYRNWSAMLTRCGNPNSEKYSTYGGRGIAVCDRWKSFASFFEDMGECPPGMQLDRIDNDGDYSPQNCRWVTCKQNQRNRRSNRMLTHAGKTLCVAEWADRLGFSPKMILFRLKRGWSVDRALTTPNMRSNHAT